MSFYQFRITWPSIKSDTIRYKGSSAILSSTAQNSFRAVRNNWTLSAGDVSLPRNAISYGKKY